VLVRDNSGFVLRMAFVPRLLVLSVVVMIRNERV
jgi:hypothetical protein